MRLWILALVLACPPAALAAGDASHGEEIYSRCLACHAPDVNRTGPKHCDVVGRKAGALPDFKYSAAMRHANLTWDEATLDRFLAAPTRIVPRTAMTYAGVPGAKDRADLIAYLATLRCR
jgi:cytochrome c